MTVPAADAPFIEPYAIAGNPKGFRSKGNTALAVKRALAHLGFLEWEPDQWDEHWNAALNDAAAAWKRQRDLIPSNSSDGSWGEKAHTTMRGTWFGPDQRDAFDGESQRLLKEEKKEWDENHPPPAPDKTPEQRVREKLTDFATRAIGEPWNYSQNRAIDVSVNPDDNSNESDCSGTVIQAFHYAKRETGLAVPDPAKQNWSGYGNTQYYECEHPKVNPDGPFKVGDLAHYDGHVTMCYRAGDAQTADWLSFGSEPPSTRKLHYRDDFWKVVRPPLVKK